MCRLAQKGIEMEYAVQAHEDRFKNEVAEMEAAKLQ